MTFDSRERKVALLLGRALSYEIPRDGGRNWLGRPPKSRDCRVALGPVALKALGASTVPITPYPPKFWLARASIKYIGPIKHEFADRQQTTARSSFLNPNEELFGFSDSPTTKLGSGPTEAQWLAALSDTATCRGTAPTDRLSCATWSPPSSSTSRSGQHGPRPRRRSAWPKSSSHWPSGTTRRVGGRPTAYYLYVAAAIPPSQHQLEAG